VRDGNHYDIMDVVDRWYDSAFGSRDEGMDYYKVRTKDGRFLLRYDRKRDVWGIKQG
jgi:hypothetical protein